MKRLVLLAVVLLWTTPAWAQCGVYKTWAPHEVLTSNDLNLAFQRTVDANTPVCAKGYSLSVSQMQITTNPYPSNSESLATTLAGELERLRFQVKALIGKAQWYYVADNSVARDVPKHWGATYQKMTEIADPAPPLGTTEGALYFKDDGAGNLVLAYEDHNGTVQTLTGPSSSFGNQVTLNLTITNNVGSPNTELDVSADRISVDGFIKRNFSATLNGASVGANGLDTGALTANTLYYLWMIYRPLDANFATLLSLSETNPSLPGLYTRKRLIGAWKTDELGQLVGGTQLDDTFGYAAGECTTDFAPGGPVATNAFDTCIPNHTAKTATFTVQFDNTAGGGTRAFKMGSVNFLGGIAAQEQPVAFFLPAAASFSGLVGFGPFQITLINPAKRSTIYVEDFFDFIRIRVVGWTMQWTDP